MSRSSFALFALLGLTLLAVPFRGAAHSVTNVADTSSVYAINGDVPDDKGTSADRARVRAKDAGSIDGEVVAVDYRMSRFTVKAGSTTYDIVVLPSTDFQGPNNSFHGMADIKKGAHVNVMLSQRATTYTAQIIHLH